MINRDAVPLRTPRRSRRLLTWVVVGLIFLLLALRSIGAFWTDFLWFESIGQARVWRTLLFTRVWLVAIAAVVAFLLFWANLLLADRLSPRRPALSGSPDEELLERFQTWVEPRIRWVRLAVAAFFGITIGLGASVWWEDFLLFRYGGDFGTLDPIFGNDIGFYVFQLPFMRSTFGWTFQLFLVIALVTAALHYLNGGIQIQALRRTTPGVKVHLSILFAVLALLKAFGYLLDRWELLYSERGRVFGASYTDVNAQRLAFDLLILISVVGAIILLVNLRFGGWTLPLVALGLWLFTSIAIGGIYPAIVQRFRVVPDEINKEVEFVEHNIAATRFAYGLSNVEVRKFGASPNLTGTDLASNRDTIDNIRLWDPSVLNRTYEELQEFRPFYGIEDVDVDRYIIDGKLTQVMVSARELDEPLVPVRGWVNERLVYTHGFGAVLSPANAVDKDGNPEFLIGDIPPVVLGGAPEIAQPRIYFSDSAERDYLIAATTQDELDFPEVGGGGETVVFNSYEGGGGIRLGGLLRRAAFALRFGHVDVLISGRLDDDSRVLLERNIRSRLAKVAPFLSADADPYIIMVNGELKWVVDMYTVSDRYPYSQSTISDTTAFTARLDRPEGNPALPSRFNYIRNSVKVVVDAFDGSMTFYVVDPSDPIIAAHQRIYPTLFTPGDAMPQEIREHLRYPQDLFRVQSDAYSTYHITDSREFFSDLDPWQIAPDPSTSVRRVGTRLPVFLNADQTEFRPMLPYYLLMKLPGEEDLSFLLLQPFTPLTRPNMVSFMVAKSDGQIIEYRMPTDRPPQGPGQVGALINQDPEISSLFTLTGQQGSEVIQGNMLIIPVEESLLYVQPIYLAAAPTEGGQFSTGSAVDIPQVQRIVVSFNEQIAIQETLDEALAEIFGDSGAAPVTPTPVDPPDGDGPADVPPEVADLLQKASTAFAEADAALATGDLGLYADKVKEAQGYIADAVELLGTGIAA